MPWDSGDDFVGEPNPALRKISHWRWEVGATGDLVGTLPTHIAKMDANLMRADKAHRQGAPTSLPCSSLNVPA
jgi:hypothetical protein